MNQRLDKIIKELNLPTDKDILHATAALYKHKITNYNVLKTSEQYYNFSLQERLAQIPQLHDVNQLTKCLLYKNKMAKDTDNVLGYSQYYLIIIQYTRKYLEPHFYSALRKFTVLPQFSHLTKHDYKFDLVDQNSDECKQIMDAQYNGMSIFGLKKNIPVIVDQNIINSKIDKIMCGGLHPFVKIIINLSDLMKMENVHVLDISEDKSLNSDKN